MWNCIKASRTVDSGVALYAELLPDQLDALWARNAVAIVPWGALEWHGPHLPLGLDGLVAKYFSEQLAHEIESVLLPPIWLPITTLPHRHSQQIRTETFRMLLDDLFAGLYSSGARRIALITGHYAQAHMIEISEAALRAMEDHAGLLVFAASPLELLAQSELLDHAGHFETSQLMAIRPDLVQLDNLSSTDTESTAVLGEAPQLASAEEGVKLFSLAIETWKHWLATSSRGELIPHYRTVFDNYEPYVEAFYKGSWEDAIQAWWQTKTTANG